MEDGLKQWRKKIYYSAMKKWELSLGKLRGKLLNKNTKPISWGWLWRK